MAIVDELWHGVPMVAARQPTVFSEREYLALEAVSDTKHELVDGEIVAMAGAELEHNLICTNALALLRQGLSPRRCVVVGSDQRLKVEAHDAYFYPDVTVTCAEPQLVGPAPRSLTNPQLIIEVLSPSTEVNDRARKWFVYQQITTLTDYVLVSSTEVLVEHFQRGSDAWLYRRLGDGDTLALSNGLTIGVAALYQLVPGLDATT